MAMKPVSSQPLVPGVIEFLLTSVDVLSPPPNATDIVTAGQPVAFRVNGQVTGLPFIVGMYADEPVEVKIHFTPVETGIPASTHGPYTFMTPAVTPGATSFAFSFVTPPLTTGIHGSAANLTTAPGDDDGVYRPLLEVHFTAARANSAFADGVLVVTAP